MVSDENRLNIFLVVFLLNGRQDFPLVGVLSQVMFRLLQLRHFLTAGYLFADLPVQHKRVDNNSVIKVTWVPGKRRSRYAAATRKFVTRAFSSDPGIVSERVYKQYAHQASVKRAVDRGGGNGACARVTTDEVPIGEAN